MEVFNVVTIMWCSFFGIIPGYIPYHHEIQVDATA